MNELPKYSLKEVAKHDGKNEGSLWIVINDMVYDVTDYKHKVSEQRYKENYNRLQKRL